VNLEVAAGEIVSLLGRNGVGRSTTCKAIMGLVDPVGEVSWKGRNLAGLRPDVIAAPASATCRRNRQIFPTLTTVRQKPGAGGEAGGTAPDRWSFDELFALFPHLR
jgi:branched-chain amino acid transport system ATP-binding protein